MIARLGKQPVLSLSALHWDFLPSPTGAFFPVDQPGEAQSIVDRSEYRFDDNVVSGPLFALESSMRWSNERVA
jgi:hypothetical protein